MKKVLYSPGFGAGWTTWACGEEVARYIGTYQPLIDFIEGGGKMDSPEADQLLSVLAEECEKQFGETLHTGGAQDLEVHTFPDDEVVCIDEYDGNETIRSRAEGIWF